MSHHTELDSAKYFEAKTAADNRTLRRCRTVETMKMFILSAIIMTGFTMACLALLNSPEVVLNAVESLKAQGLWPF